MEDPIIKISMHSLSNIKSASRSSEV